MLGHRTRGASALARTAALAAAASLAMACAPIDQDVILALDESSQLNVDLPSSPGNVTTLRGGIIAHMNIEISLFRVLFGLPLQGTITPVDLLIAGTSFEVLPGFELSTLCLYPDAADPGSGTVSVSLGDQEVTIAAVTNGLVTVVDPAVRAILGDPLPFPVEVDSVAPLSIGDLLGVLGGASLPLSLEQDVNVALVSPNPLLNGGAIHGTLLLNSVDEFPTGFLISVCENFLDGFLP